MNLFTISQLSRFSGIKPHTIRIWEQRYDALKPNRSEGNTRYYDDLQLRRLLNIVSLMDAGFKISELGGMSDKKIFSLLEQRQKKDHYTEGEEFYISQLIGAGMSYDEQHFEKIFSHCLLRFGLKDSYIHVLYPMLVRIGLLWASDTIPPAQEHFISNMIRQKLFTAIDSLPPAAPGAESWLLFLPEDEWHEIGLLFANYMIRLSGKKSVYLGSNIPFDSLRQAIKDIKPDKLLLFLVSQHYTEKKQQLHDALRTLFPVKNIYLAGSMHLADTIEIGKMNWLQTPDDLDRVLQSVVVEEKRKIVKH